MGDFPLRELLVLVHQKVLRLGFSKQLFASPRTAELGQYMLYQFHLVPRQMESTVYDQSVIWCPKYRKTLVPAQVFETCFHHLPSVILDPAW
jgi:hypothetical protein